MLNADQLTNEQRQLLAQMQADMRQQPTQLNEVPWNEQTPEQRQQTLQRQRQVQQQQWNNAQQQAQQPRQRAAEQPYQQPQTRTAQAAPVQQPKAQPKPDGPAAVSGSAANACAYRCCSAENTAGRANNE